MAATGVDVDEVDCTGFLVDVLKLRDPDELRNVLQIIMSICHLAHRIIRKVNITYHETLESFSLWNPIIQMSK